MPVFFVVAECAPADVGGFVVFGRAGIGAMSLIHVVGPLAVVNMALDERHDSSARSDAIGPLTRVGAHELKGLGTVDSQQVPRPLRMSLSASPMPRNVLPEVAIGAGTFKAGHLAAAGWLAWVRAAQKELT
jgi:hypothetical protein